MPDPSGVTGDSPGPETSGDGERASGLDLLTCAAPRWPTGMKLGAPPAPLVVRRGPGLHSLPTNPSWHEHYERVLMTRTSGGSASLALLAQAAPVVRRGTAPTFMKEFSS